MAKHSIRKAEDPSGEPYINVADLAAWIESLEWSTDLHQSASNYIVQELRLMGLSDPDGLIL